MRHDGRKNNEMRPVKIRRSYLRNAEGSALIEVGGTRVICAASIEETVPRFLYGQGQGWITAEYGMLPRSTESRMNREAARGRSGRTYEIQRLIGRSLRSAVQMDLLPEVTIVVDCDVIEADGGTRTAAITGGFVAMYDAMGKLGLNEDPVNYFLSAISVGLVDDQLVMDLDYYEDSNAQVDMNLIMSEGGAFVEIQGTAERRPFTPDELDTLLGLGRKGCMELIQAQRDALGLSE